MIYTNKKELIGMLGMNESRIVCGGVIFIKVIMLNIAACLLLCGCGPTIYSITKNDHSVVKNIDKSEDGVPIVTYLYGCENYNTVFVDRDKNYWLFCQSSFDTSFVELVKAGPGLEKQQIYQFNSAKYKDVSKMIETMMMLPKVACKGPGICFMSPYNKNLLKLTIEKSTHKSWLEYNYLATDGPLLPPKKLIINSCKGASDKVLMDNLDGTVTDNDSGLTWRRCAFGKLWDKQNMKCSGSAINLSWDQAIGVALEDSFAGYQDWRVPTEQEFNSLIPKNCNNCLELRRVMSFVFMGYESSYAYGDAHWLADNSSDLKNPAHANLEVSLGLGGCSPVSRQLRPFAEKPVMLVRGGQVQNAWIAAKDSIPYGSKVNEESRKEAAVYWGAVNKKVKDFFASVNNSSTANENIDFVLIDANVVAGFSSCTVTDYSISNLNGRPDSDSPGNISDDRHAIHKGYSGGLAGKYRWSAKFNCGKQYCGGVFSISGTKRNVKINFYDSDCSLSGTSASEF